MNANDETYNGYANFETWCVALWIDNDPGLYEQRCELVRDALEAFRDDDNEARYAVRSTLEDWLDEIAPDLGASLWSDLLTSALSAVDCDELARMWITEAAELVED